MTDLKQDKSAPALHASGTTSSSFAGEVPSSRRAFASIVGALGALALTGCSADSESGAGRALSDLDELRQAHQSLVGTGVVKIADTAANLRTITGGTTTWVAILHGIAGAGDGGGGTFYWSTVAKADDGWSSLNASAANSAGWRRVNAGFSSVQNIAALRALVGGASLAIAIVSDYQTAGDGGGGVFRWSTVAAADDRGTVINPAGGTNVGWRRIYTGAVHASWFGTKGDGIVDDTNAIKDALAVAAARSTTLYFPAGTYRVLENLGITGASYVHLVGAGMNATSIRDGRLPTSSGPTGLYYGLLSFVNCHYCSIQDLTIVGPCTPPFDNFQTPDNSRKGTFFNNSDHCWVERVRGTLTKDECLYADGPDSVDWRVSHCVVQDVNSNGINLNTGAAEGAHIHDNWIANAHGNAINVAATTAVIHGNTISVGTDTPAGGDPIAVDASSRAVITNNIIYDSNTSTSSLSGITLFGTSAAGSCHIISGNILRNILSDWDDNTGAGISINNVSGTVLVANNVIDGCGRDWGPDGRAISVFGANTGRVHIVGNSLRNRPNRNIRVGVKVFSDVPAGMVTVGANYTEDMLRPYELGSPSSVGGRRRSVTTLGATALGEYDEDVFIAVNGAVALTLPAASRFSSGAKRITVKNTTAQAGTTTLSASSSLIDGSASVSVIGANAAVTLAVDGTGWCVVARV